MSEWYLFLVQTTESDVATSGWVVTPHDSLSRHRPVIRMIDTNETGDDAAKRRTETHHVHYDPKTNTGPSETLVFAVADIADVDPLDLDPLFETVDPDTLDEFVESGGVPEVGGRMEFTFADHRVTVHASGLFDVRPLD